MEKSTGKIWCFASGKRPFQRRNQQAREELLERTSRKSSRPPANIFFFADCCSFKLGSIKNILNMHENVILNSSFLFFNLFAFYFHFVLSQLLKVGSQNQLGEVSLQTDL